MDFLGPPAQLDGSELAAKLVALSATSLISFLIGVKTFNINFRYLTYSRWLVLVLYVCSWSFTVISMLLVTTNNRMETKIKYRHGRFVLVNSFSYFSR